MPIGNCFGIKKNIPFHTCYREAKAGAGAAPTQTMLIKIGKSCGKCVNSNYMGINAHIAYE